MDEQLAKLLQQIIQYPDGSPEQTRILNKLLRIVPKLSGIIKTTGNHQIEYAVVLNKALENVSGIYQTKDERDLINLRKLINRIEKLLTKLDSDLSDEDREYYLKSIREIFVTWFNRILRTRILDEADKLPNSKKIVIINIDNLIYEDGNLTVGETIADINSINDIGSIINDEDIAQNQSLYERVKAIINSDEFNCYPGDLIKFTCKELIYRMEVNKEKLSHIIRHFGYEPKEKYQTINSHYKRTCKKLLAKIPQLLASLAS
jgi:hypothetical protein